MASYWWQTNKDSGKGIHWLSWDKLCKHKKGGGMGFRNLHEVNPFVISDHPALSLATVSNLLTPDGPRWDAEVLDDLFVDRDKHLIMSIPLHDNNLEDHFVWSKETSGFYTIKSAYNLLQKLKGGWYETNDNNFWSKLWSLKLPPKIKNLMWRAAVGVLPTMIQLRTKHVENRVGISTISDSSIPFLDWCTSVKCKLNAEKKSLVAAVCWAIWSARNELVWKGKTTQHWSPPLANSIKVNVDAALFDDGRSFGSGLVARDDRGWLVEGRTILVLNKVEPIFAEAISVKEALTWIKLKQWHHVTMESDCLGVVQALRSSICMISLFGQVIQSCKNLLADLSTVEVIFVKRFANLVAHRFVRVSKLYPDRTFSMESVPTDLLPYLVTEFVGL
ncbi:uncharacterized protein LOC115700161 [Cannabis sativa]|uniref:uncharacterized protein LOC115700161 n=1 Tax=Cannabis sativa TaxID=3483 RepID=UPI0029CA1686|nr:uncharacterized protein LOC115700161 [Cannabis sativa]